MSPTVFISGASSGIGEACAHAFAKAGYRLILAARRKQRLQSLAATLAAKTSCHVVALDVTQRQQVLDVVGSLPAAFSNVAILINNAGLALGTELAQNASLDDWDAMIDTNIKGLTYLTRAILPGMMERQAGHIVNIGSTAGDWPYPGGNAYCGTKAFVAQFSRGLRADLIGTPLRVSCISPGMVATEFSTVRMKGDQDRADQVYEGTTPLSGEDIAGIALWLCSVPSHININAVEVMPVCQAWGGWSVDRVDSNG